MFRSSVIPIRSFIDMKFIGLDAQRDVNSTHKEELVRFYTDYENRKRLIQYTPIFIGRLNNHNYLLDGQHRYSALRELRALIKPDELIEAREFQCETMAELEDHFRCINSSHPLSSYLIRRDIQSEMRRALRDLINRRYKEFIKFTDKPHAPNFNPDFIDRMDMSAVEDWFQSRGTEMSIDGFLEQFEYGNQVCINYLIEHKADSEIVKGYSRLLGCENRICVGFKMNWFDVMFCNAEPRLYKRQAIPQSFRNQLWKVYRETFGKVTCCACDKSIPDSSDGECGHIRSVYSGGVNELSNLIPICSLCNKSCSYKSLEAYMKHIGRSLDDRIAKIK